MAKPYKRLLRNYLINRKYQLRYTLIMVIICTGLTGILDYSWYGQMRVASDMVEVHVLGSKSESYALEVREDLASYDRHRVLMLIGFGATLCLAVALFGILLTHKVAGPLRYLSTILGQISAGRLGHLRMLREGDFLEDFFGSFKEAHEALRTETEQDLETVSQVIEGIDSAQKSLRQDAEKDLDALNEAIEGVESMEGGELLSQELQALREMRDRKEARLA